jgi:transcriptional regulator with XRE-family HTH domain
MNFKIIISNLMESGLTQHEIAAAAGSSQAHISCLLSGRRKQPNWALGDALLRLHAEVCARRKDAA